MNNTVSYFRHIMFKCACGARYFGPRVATHPFFTHTQKEGRKDKRSLFTALIAVANNRNIHIGRLYVFTVLVRRHITTRTFSHSTFTYCTTRMLSKCVFRS